MRILSNTSVVPTRRIREIVRFVGRPGVYVKSLRVDGRRTGHAGAYSASTHTVVVSIGPERRRPGVKPRLRARPEPGRRGRKGYLWFARFSAEENAVATIAHEWRHAEQDQHLQIRAERPYANSNTLADWWAVRRSGGTLLSPSPVPGGVPAGAYVLRWFDNTRLPGMVWGSDPTQRFSELDADAYSLRMLRAWRRSMSPPPHWRAAVPVERRAGR